MTKTARARRVPMRTICNGYNCSRVLPVIRPRQYHCSAYCQRMDADRVRYAKRGA